MRRLSLSTRTRLVALLALALIVRALVPTGWMPIATDDGVRLVLCPGQGHAVAGMHHGGGHGHDAPMPDHPCAFAGLGLAADTAPAPLILPLPPLAEPPAPSEVFAVAIGQGLAAPPPPATGPPTFA